MGGDVAEILALDQRAAMRAAVDEGMDPPVLGPVVDDGRLADEGAAKIPRIRDLGFQPEEAPGLALEDALDLEPVERLVAIPGVGNAIEAGTIHRLGPRNLLRRESSAYWVGTEPVPSARRQSATASSVSTLMRCARYSALPWMSGGEPVGRNRDLRKGAGVEGAGERTLERLHAEHAGARPGDRHPDGAVGEAGEEHAHDGEPRCRVGELAVACRGGDREPNFDDQLALLQRGLEHANEEAAGGDPPPSGDDLRVERQHRRGVAGGGVVVGERSADGPPVAHQRIADPAGERGERRDSLPDRRGDRHRRVPGHRPDGEGGGLDGDAGQAADRGEIHQIRRRRETVLHHRDQAHPAGERAPVPVPGKNLLGVGEAPRAVVVIAVHQPSAIAAAPARIAATMFW